MNETYADAGVNIALAAKAKELINKHVRDTRRPEVLSAEGFFGGLFEFAGYNKPVLTSSVDGVGTKLRIAMALDRHDTIGIDLVNHCVNDILTCGAEPIFFLDYIAMGKLVPERVESIVKGVASACKGVGCALIGGETAEMPGIYTGGDYDIAGFIVGVVEKDRIINGRNIAAGDAIIGLPSSGLHTNGYSLVRKIISAEQLNTHYAELGRTLGEALLEPHRCYYHELKPLLPLVKGIAHITGGGLIDNVPRVLPEATVASVFSQAWEVPPLFQLIRKWGNITLSEMYHVFNMGIGIVIICSPENARQCIEKLPGALIIGEVQEQEGEARVIISDIEKGAG